MAPSTPSTVAGHGTTHVDALSSSQPSSSVPVEMSDLQTPQGTGAGSQGPLHHVSISTTSPLTSIFPTSSASGAGVVSEHTMSTEPNKLAVSGPESLSTNNETATVTSTASAAVPSSAHSTVNTRLGSATAEPSTDTMQTATTTNEPGPVLVITLLLTSGARHPYKIDEKYLIKRNVNVPGTTESGRKDPFSISVYTLKELILREWREEWEAQPSSPSSIRLIYFGRLLDDKTALKECKFNADAANVVHMTVRPQDMIDEEDASKSKSLARERDASEDTAGCRCVIL